MKSFIITLEHRPERLANAAKLTKALSGRGYAAEMHFAIDRKVTNHSYFPIAEDAKRHLTNEPLQGGDICCYQSHLSVARKMVALNLPWCYVFEDDAFMFKDGLATIKQLQEVLSYRKKTKVPDFGFILLHSNKVSWETDIVVEEPNGTIAVDLLTPLAKKPMLMHGYAMSQTIARILLQLPTQKSNWDAVSRQVALDAGLTSYRITKAVVGLATELARVSYRLEPNP